MGSSAKIKTLMTVEEIISDLLMQEQEVKMLDRTLRSQGYSKVLAVTKIIPESFTFLRIYKLRQHKNAVLLLIIDPAQQGYNAQTRRDASRD